MLFKIKDLNNKIRKLLDIVIDFFVQIIVPENKKYSFIFFIFIGVFTIVSVIGALHIEIDNDVTVLLPVNEETEYERDKINRLGKEFSSSQLLFVGVTNKNSNDGSNRDASPFTVEGIKNLYDLCVELDNLDVVKSTFNPFNSTYFKKVGNTFSIKRLKMNYYPKTEEEIKQFIENISSNRYMIGSIISFDKETAGIVVRFNENAEMGKEVKNPNVFQHFSKYVFGKKIGKKKIDRSYFCKEIEKVLTKYNNKFNIYYAGVPVYESKTKAYMQKDIFRLIIPIFILMTIIFFMNFRTLNGTLLPILSILLSMGCTMGLVGWMRYKLNIVGVLIPPLVMTVGSSYTLHYLNSYYINSAFYNNPRELVIHSTKSIFPTIFLASITTIVGFASFLTAKIKPIKMFGFFIIISIILTLFFTFFLLSKVLSLIQVPKQKNIENVKNDLFSKILNFSRDIVIPFRFLWAGIFILMLIVFLIVIPNIKIETNPATYFKKNDMVKKSLVYLQKNFHGTNHYNITIRSVENKRNFFKTREGLLAAKKIQDYFDKNIKIDGFSMVGWSLSPVTLVEDLNNTLNGTYDVPEDEKDIKTFFNLLTGKFRQKNGKISRDAGIRSIINDNFSAITFQVRPHTTNKVENNMMTEQELSKLTNKITNDLQEISEKDGRFTVEIWGEILLLARISKYLIKDQIWSLTFTAILVFFITLIIFRSPYFAFFSLIPLSFGVIVNFTIMSIFHISLDAATVMIAAISIGIGIDDSIHFILHYKKALKRGLNAKEAVLDTLSYTSRPILFTSMALIIGFSLFFVSSFGPITYFGILIAISMFNCTFATLFILPSFFIITDKLRIIIHKKRYIQ